ncbi:hypothetical protein AAH979_36980 [Plantactinospora sp. ZYX-F-223]|uniref:hypothetical protein n=1 Tax=Plantactinospora sp. ZYX-F-223 TaxID=3144103 RepID=UPI0031FC767A
MPLQVEDGGAGHMRAGHRGTAGHQGGAVRGDPGGRDVGDLDRARQHFAHALAGYTELDSLEAETVRTVLAALPATAADG